MWKSRPVQYFGLALLVLASLIVIFCPVGPRPQAQPYTLRFSAPKPFATLAPKGTPAPDAADAALNAAFPSGEKLPGALTVSPDGRTATLIDNATTQAEAQGRAARITAALSKTFPGLKAQNTEAVVERLPVAPLLPLGQIALFPPRRGADGNMTSAVKLGLDLQGGVNLVMQVRRAVFPFTLSKPLGRDIGSRDRFVSQVRAALANAGNDLDDANIVLTPNRDDQVEVRTQASDRAQFNAQQTALNNALKNVGGVQLSPAKATFFQPETNEDGGTSVSQNDVLARTVEIVRSRVDNLGVSEPLIQEQRPDRIIVQLPGVNDPQRAVEVVGQTAQLNIYLLPQELRPLEANGQTRFVDSRTGAVVPNEEVIARSERIVSGRDVKPTTTVGFAGASEPAIFFDLQGEGATRFAQVTTQVAGQNRFIPIFLDQRCITSPTVESPITGGSGQISGGFANIEEARDIALLLNSGALPAPIDVVENRTVSATLGSESLSTSLRAGVFGLAAVALFMAAFYRLPGLLANFALIIYGLLNLAVFNLVGGTLTLPGIAGFLLAAAVSLDTNILVFERLKEEMAIQPDFKSALRAAFDRAWTAILDSHVTTLIASVVLFFLGTGPVKGFALTLGIGVLLSLFSAISVTRLFMWSVSRTGERNRNLFGKPVERADVVVPPAKPVGGRTF